MLHSRLPNLILVYSLFYSIPILLFIDEDYLSTQQFISSRFFNCEKYWSFGYLVNILRNIFLIFLDKLVTRLDYLVWCSLRWDLTLRSSHVWLLSWSTAYTIIIAGFASSYYQTKSYCNHINCKAFIYLH